MHRLIGHTQQYAWGSKTLLADLRGAAPSEEPEAEIWYGAHPKAPSTFENGTTLLEVIDEDTVCVLGEAVVDRFGARLPFLLKLLAAGSPLSIQAHPSIEQARAGFAAEEAAGVDRAAPDRSFRDDNHKPELICALTPFEALVGFRPPEHTQGFFAAIGFGALDDVLRDAGPKGVVVAVLAPDPADAPAVATAVETLVECAARHGDAQARERGQWAGECALIGRLAAQYPGDPGIIVASLLNYVTLQPGQAMYLGAGNMHAYVSGLGVELMANSDNVLRGGLTPKHIDVENLLDVVLPDAMVPTPVPVELDGTYVTPAPEFALRRVVPAGDEVTVTGPSILLCTTASVQVTSEESGAAFDLAPTDALWLSADEIATVTGSGTAWLASVGATTTLVGG